MTKLDAENKKNSNQPKQCARSSRRWSVVGLKNETSKRIACQTRPDGEITANHAGHTGHHPKHHKLRRAIKLLNVRADNPQAVHVHDEMQQLDVEKHGRNEAPPLMLGVNIGV